MEYITCHYRKSWPTVPRVVCEKCKRRGGCTDYQAYMNPSLFSNLDQFDNIKRTIRRKRIKPESTEICGPEQLTFDY